MIFRRTGRLSTPKAPPDGKSFSRCGMVGRSDRNPIPRGDERVSTRTKTKEKPGIARLVAARDIDDDAEERQRVGVQSLGRAFGILEEVARHREGINLADLSKRVGLHNSTTFHLVKTM